MNDQKIYECIALNGPMTAQAIADEMGVHVDDALGQLAALRGIGDLVLVQGVYSFSRSFSISEDCRRARAKAAAVQQGRAAAGETMLDRALNFLIAKGGTCLAWELHAALGLAPDQLPSNVLAEDLAAERIFREGRMWFLDRREVPRQKQRMALEEELDGEPARRVELVTVLSGSRVSSSTTIVTPLNEAAADMMISLGWTAAPKCDTDNES